MKILSLLLFVLLLSCANGDKNTAEEWQRTNPDTVVYLPTDDQDGDNEHFLVFEAPLSDELLALWTQSSLEGRGDNRIAFARSSDGKSWSEPYIIAGKTRENGQEQASWAFPIVSKGGYIYCFYTSASRRLGCFYSTDNGFTWIEGAEIRVPKNKFDAPDPNSEPTWIVWQKPVRDRHDKHIVGYTHISSAEVVPPPTNNWVDQDSRCAFMRFENIDTNPLPEAIEITWLPLEGEGLEVPHKLYPQISVSQEPAIVLLPDGRLFCAMRTMTGYIWYSVSDDDGASWRLPEAMRYTDDGEMIPNPLAPSPIYQLDNGRYMLIFYNNAGVLNGYNQFDTDWESNYADYLRNPAYIAMGEFRSGARQPLWFSRPQTLLDTNDVPFGPKGTAEVATYASVTETGGQRTLWYPDRKYFLLGKYLSDELLDAMTVDPIP